MSADAADPSAVVRTRAGEVRGRLRDGVSVFKGVPYAASTAGENRFRPARPHQGWDGVREAVAFGDRCPQLDFPGLLAEEAMSLGTEPMSEDCLNLNIWTPGPGAGARPVMVWLHGGLFIAGSGAGTRYDGARLAARRDVVVVTVNHRLNLFGFLDLRSFGPEFEDSANLGLRDCIAALAWIRDNIAAFGGDPGNVTVFGESGGGSKASVLMAMPAARGLFHRVIAQSGVALRAAPAAAHVGLARRLLETLGLEAGDASELRRLPVERLLHGLGELGMAGAFGLVPVVDGDTLPRDPFTPSAPDASADVPMMVGANETEATFFPNCPLDPIDEQTLVGALAGFTQLPPPEVERLVALYRNAHPGKDQTYLFQLIASDWWLGADVALQAERKAEQGGAPAYVYYFAKHSPTREGKLRAVHTLEIPYVFDNLALAEPLTGAATGENQALAETMSAAWTNFARAGDPNGPGVPEWPAYRRADRQVMVFADRSGAVADPYPQLREAIRALKDRAG